MLPVLGLYGEGTHPHGCQSADARAFAFWVGKWSLSIPSGPTELVSGISSGLSHCAVLENFNGEQGISISRFDRVSGQWLQDYVDNTGFTLRLHGGIDATGTLRVQDDVRVLPNGLALKSRIDWTPNPDGTVRQLFLLSFDGGATYPSVEELLYSRTREYAEPAPPTLTPCLNRPAARALDALVGEWVVREANGTRLGRVNVTLRAGACALEEIYRGRGGVEQRTVLHHDRFVGRWFRASVDNAGNTFRVGGVVAGSSLDATGAAPSREGGTVPVRLAWDLSDPTMPIQRWSVQSTAGSWAPLSELRWSRPELEEEDD